MELFDPWASLSTKRRKNLDRSWPGLFQKEILQELPVRELSRHFKNGFGRPTKELYSILGALLLQQQFDLTDEETCDQFSYNIQWHYALNITEESDSAKYLCPKTIWSMRCISTESNLDSLMFDNVSRKLASIFNVDTDNQRIDSVHIKSNMRRLGRISIFSSTIHKFLINLKRQYKDHFRSIDKDIVDTYFSEKSLTCFSMVKPSESAKTLKKVSNDLFDLIQRFKGNADLSKMYSYKLLERVLNDQCNLKEIDGKNTVEVKAPKDIPSDSLQNPSDPDVTYSGHKGQGYQVQIMETYNETGDKDAKTKPLNLITHVEVEKACQSDANALIPAIESANNRNLGPKETLADSLYGSDENCQTAKRMGVEVVSPTMGSQKDESISLSGFEMSKKGSIVLCPKGNCPVETKKKKTRHSAAFEIQHCNTCPNKSICLVKQGKKHYYLRYTDKEMRIAKRRAYEDTEEFKDRYRWRAGVEATMSEYDRRTGVKKLRVRGLKAVRFAATLKAIGVNIFRAVAVIKAIFGLNSTSDQGKLKFISQILIFKERCKTNIIFILHKCRPTPYYYKYVTN
jgi:hypothetical protein